MTKCVSYRKNTVQALLEVHHPDLAPFYSIHRLDKIVSGILIFARTSEAARSLQEQMKVRFHPLANK